jgi:hypothetical protein
MSKESSEKYPDKIEIIEDILSRDDPVKRGIEYLRNFLKEDLRGATTSLINAEEVYIITGFFIPTAKTIETDGLSGTVFLAKALTLINKRVFILTDPHNREILIKGFNAVRIYPTIISPNFEYSPQTWISPTKNSVLIAVERPGKGIDGKRRTMRGIEIPAYPLDEIFIEIPRKEGSVKTISCADGLNEVGMGKLPRGVIPKDIQIQSIIPVDYLIVAGTADWASFGLIAALSVASERDLLPQQREQKRFLEAIVAAGAVDGITGKSELTVDTLPLEIHQEKVKYLRQILS